MSEAKHTINYGAEVPADQRVQVGDYVRSYDFFPARSDCYIEGTVIEYGFMLGCRRYKIKAERRVWAGEEAPVIPEEAEVIPPQNGIPTIGLTNVTCGVVKVERAGAKVA